MSLIVYEVTQMHLRTNIHIFSSALLCEIHHDSITNLYMCGNIQLKLSAFYDLRMDMTAGIKHIRRPSLNGQQVLVSIDVTDVESTKNSIPECIFIIQQRTR